MAPRVPGQPALPVPLTQMIRLRSEIEALSAMAANAGRLGLAASCDETADRIDQWIADVMPAGAGNPFARGPR